MGPFATQILAQMGADVIKVEGPEGDDMRRVGPMRNEDMGALFLPANNGKRSVVLDLEAHADSSRWVWQPVDQAAVAVQEQCRLSLRDAFRCSSPAKFFVNDGWMRSESG